MNSPIDRRQQQLQKAEKARDFLSKTDSVKDIGTRAALLHDRIADSVRDICSEEDNCFNETQIKILSDIAVHIALLMDPSQKRASSFLGKLRGELREATISNRIILFSALVAMFIGVAQMASWGVGQVAYLAATLNRNMVVESDVKSNLPDSVSAKAATSK